MTSNSFGKEDCCGHFLYSVCVCHAGRDRSGPQKGNAARALLLLHSFIFHFLFFCFLFFCFIVLVMFLFIISRGESLVTDKSAADHRPKRSDALAQRGVRLYKHKYTRGMYTAGVNLYPPTGKTSDLFFYFFIFFFFHLGSIWDINGDQPKYATTLNWMIWQLFFLLCLGFFFLFFVWLYFVLNPFFFFFRYSTPFYKFFSLWVGRCPIISRSSFISVFLPVVRPGVMLEMCGGYGTTTRGWWNAASQKRKSQIIALAAAGPVVFLVLQQQNIFLFSTAPWALMWNNNKKHTHSKRISSQCLVYLQKKKKRRGFFFFFGWVVWRDLCNGTTLGSPLFTKCKRDSPSEPFFFFVCLFL